MKDRMTRKQEEIYNRVLFEANYIIENEATVRECAKVSGVSKSSVHRDIVFRLPDINPGLYEKVASVIKKNKEDRHLRGGNATKEKYQKLRKKNKRCEIKKE